MARKSRKNLDNIVVESVNTSPIYNAAGYIRLSVEDNHKKGDSVENQKAIIQNFIEFAPDIKLHDYYVDNGISGTTFERQAFKKMLDDAENGVINCMIVKDLSRFGRSAIDTGYYIEKYLPSIKCRFIAVNDDFDSNGENSGAGVILPLKNMINEAYALDIGRKIKAQQRQAMKSGDYIGARPPYGYLKSPENCHKLIIDPNAAAVVRKIFGLFLANVSVNEIVRRLNEADIITPSHYRKESGLITNENLIGNGSWQTVTVNRILMDGVYIGDMVQGKSRCTLRKQTNVDKSEWIRVENTHEAIISREDFTNTQERLRFLADKSAAKSKTPFTPNIFKGKVFCGHCGGSMHRQREIRKKSGEVYLYCCLSNSRKARGSCVSYIMLEKELINILLTTIHKHADVIVGKALKLRANSAEIETKRKEVTTEITALRQEADKDGRMLKSLYESLASGIITADEYKEMRENYNRKTQEAIARAAELEKWHNDLDAQINEYFDMSDLVENAVNNGITARVVDCLIDKIKIFSDRHIEVEFKFDSGFELIKEAVGNE
ncbi:MAG: recombinase family protein [Oscillospiraceae bacterium]|nr:recombinase family protein [Oscillospiraceae bacterium]